VTVMDIGKMGAFLSGGKLKKIKRNCSVAIWGFSRESRTGIVTAANREDMEKACHMLTLHAISKETQLEEIEIIPPSTSS